MDKSTILTVILAILLIIIIIILSAFIKMARIHDCLNTPISEAYKDDYCRDVINEFLKEGMSKWNYGCVVKIKED